MGDAPLLTQFRDLLALAGESRSALPASRARALAFAMVRDAASAGRPELALAALGILADLEAAELERLEASAMAEEERAIAADAVRQVAVLNADGGPSALTIAAFLDQAGEGAS